MCTLYRQPWPALISTHFSTLSSFLKNETFYYMYIQINKAIVTISFDQTTPFYSTFIIKRLISFILLACKLVDCLNCKSTITCRSRGPLHDGYIKHFVLMYCHLLLSVVKRHVFAPVPVVHRITVNRNDPFPKEAKGRLIKRASTTAMKMVQCSGHHYRHLCCNNIQFELLSHQAT